MNLNDLKPILDLMTMQEERLVAKIDGVHEDVKTTRDELKKLNGTVRDHQSILDKNIPHTVVHCAQKETIENIEKVILTNKAIVNNNKSIKEDRRARNTIKLMALGIIVSIIVSIFNAKVNKTTNKDQIGLEQKLDSILKLNNHEKGNIKF